MEFTPSLTCNHGSGVLFEYHVMSLLQSFFFCLLYAGEESALVWTFVFVRNFNGKKKSIGLFDSEVMRDIVGFFLLSNESPTSFL